MRPSTSLFKSAHGASATEYAVLLSLIAALAIPLLVRFGIPVFDTYRDSGGAIETARLEDGPSDPGTPNGLPVGPDEETPPSGGSPDPSSPSSGDPTTPATPPSSFDCYDPANAMLIGPPESLCEGMFIVPGVATPAMPNAARVLSNAVNDGTYAFLGPDGNTYTFEDSEYNIFTGQITSMADLFSYTAFNGDIGYWDTSNVRTMEGMFRENETFNQDISRWNVINVWNMEGVFDGATAFNQDIGSWDTRNVRLMTDMFRGATSFNQDITTWDTRSVESMGYMFAGATSFNQPLGSLHIPSVRDMNGMFSGAVAFNQDISGWDVSGVERMSDMFSYTTFNPDVVGWDVSSVNEMAFMFAGNTGFNRDISGWDVSTVSTMNGMFSGALAFDQDLSGWCVPTITSLYQHMNFDFMSGFEGATSKHPVWGTCP